MSHGGTEAQNFGPTALWPKLCEEWMRFNGWVPTSPTSLMKVQTATEAAAKSRPVGNALPAAAK